jgi:hypothetical protein
MKKWTKVLIAVVVVAVLPGWYAFRPERLVVNRRVDEAVPTTPGGLSARDGSTAFCIRRKVPPPSSSWEMVLGFSA